jgi:hypothetical protein
MRARPGPLAYRFKAFIIDGNDDDVPTDGVTPQDISEALQIDFERLSCLHNPEDEREQDGP